MSFSWSETITASTTRIKSTHVSELKTNIDTERIFRGLSGYSWTRTPGVLSQIKQTGSWPSTNPDFHDLRTAANQAYDENYCHTHLATHYTTYLSTHYTSDNASNYTHCASNYSYCGTNYSPDYNACK